MSWLQPKKETLHFISGDNGNFDFHIKVGLCRFVGFVNDVTNCGCLVYVFCFRIKEKEKDTFNIKFDSIMFVQFFFSHSFNLILIMNICVQFIIVAFYDEFITNKVL